MDLLTINEIATMLKTSEGVAKQIMGDTPYLHLGTGNAEARSSILLISTNNHGQLDTSSICPFFAWVVGVGKGVSNH